MNLISICSRFPDKNHLITLHAVISAIDSSPMKNELLEFFLKKSSRYPNQV